MFKFGSKNFGKRRRSSPSSSPSSSSSAAAAAAVQVLNKFYESKILPLPLSVCSTRFSCRTLKTIWMGKASRRMPSRHKLRC